MTDAGPPAEPTPQDDEPVLNAEQFIERLLALDPEGRELAFQGIVANAHLATHCNMTHRYVDSPPEGVRPFLDLAHSGLLWLINRQVFHPRGYALGLDVDPSDPSRVLGWRLLGDGEDPFVFDLGEDGEKEALRRVEQTMGEQRVAYAAEKRAEALEGLSEEELHRERAHPEWEYTTTTSPRKGDSKPPQGPGWEPNPVIPVEQSEDGEPTGKVTWRNWEQFDYHEEEHWRRRRVPPETEPTDG